jgi:hypothetical protein
MPQFQPGNTASLKHGGRSLRSRREARKKLTADMRGLILKCLPDLEPSDLFLVDLLETALADVRQLRDWIDSHGGPTNRGRWPTKPMDMLQSRERRALEIMDRLGFGPKARQLMLLGPGVSGGNRRGNGLASQLARRSTERALEAHG